MIIAAFAVLVSAAVSARAGEVIDFDGKNAKTVSFAETLKAAEAVQADTIKFEKVAVDGIPGRAAPAFTEQQVKEMDKSIRTAMTYVNDHQLPKNYINSFNCLLAKGTPEQKAEFVYTPEGAEYSFPGVCRAQNKNVCSWVAEKVCEQVMDPKTLLEKVVCSTVKMWVCQDPVGAIEEIEKPTTSGH